MSNFNNNINVPFYILGNLIMKHKVMSYGIIRIWQPYSVQAIGSTPGPTDKGYQNFHFGSME